MAGRSFGWKRNWKRNDGLTVTVSSEPWWGAWIAYVWVGLYGIIDGTDVGRRR